MKKGLKKNIFGLLIFSALVMLASFYIAANIKQIDGKDPSRLSKQETAAASPLPSESAAPSSAASPKPTPAVPPEPSPITASIVSAGDCVLHKTFQESARVKGEDRYDFNSIFEELKPYTEPAGLSLISFESAATYNRQDYTGYPLFNCPPEIFEAFKNAGFDLVNNSNNHQLDRKVEGMLETRENIRKFGLEVIGAYDGEEPRYMIKDLNGIKVGLMAYTYSCNGNEKALSPELQARHLALIDERRIKKELAELEGKADVTVVAMHWGTEYTQEPAEQQKKLARDMVSWGADVILGSHPHVVQPSETLEFNGKTKYIIYSMGNFVSNQRRGASGYPKTHKELAEDGMIVKIQFMKDSKTNETVIRAVDHIPTWLWRYEEDGRYKFKVIPVTARECYKNNEYPEEVLSEAYASFDRTMRLVQDYMDNSDN